MRDNSPYDEVGGNAFWRNGLSTHPLDPGALYKKAFDILPSDRIVTAGSCFAQHIAKAMRRVGLNVVDTEPAPRGLPAKDASEFGYGLYSARFANIYTARQLLQLLQEAFEGRTSPDPVWRKGDRYFDSMRPSVEPDGLLSAQEVVDHREYHLARVREMIETCDVFVFTLGLTECWEHSATGWVFPTAPGTIAGSFDRLTYGFRNLRYPEIMMDMHKAVSLIMEHARSSNLRFLFTVSPVPLTATYTGDHVQIATCYSKSVLRAVAGDTVASTPYAAYFPSFEIVTAPTSRGIFYDASMRSVNPAGVEVVMNTFLKAHGFQNGQPATKASSTDSPSEIAVEEDGVVCEDALLEAFARKRA